MVLVCHPSHRLARGGVAGAGRPPGERFVAFDHDLPIRRAIDRVLQQAGIRVDVVMEFDNIETIKQAIAIAAGCEHPAAPGGGKGGGVRMLGAVPLGDRRAGPAGRHHPPEGEAPAARRRALHRRPPEAETRPARC